MFCIKYMNTISFCFLGKIRLSFSVILEIDSINTCGSFWITLSLVLFWSKCPWPLISVSNNSFLLTRFQTLPSKLSQECLDIHRVLGHMCLRTNPALFSDSDPLVQMPYHCSVCFPGDSCYQCLLCIPKLCHAVWGGRGWMALLKHKLEYCYLGSRGIPPGA